MVVHHVKNTIGKVEPTLRMTIVVVGLISAASVWAYRQDSQLAQLHETIAPLIQAERTLDNRVQILELDRSKTIELAARLRSLELQQASILQLLEGIREDLRELKRGGG